MNNIRYLNHVEDEFKSIISSAISNSIKYGINEVKNDCGFHYSYMSKPVVKWDLIYNSIINSIKKNNEYEYHFATRGSWKVLLICNKKNGMLCSIAKLDRFSQLKQLKRKRPHYFDILALINDDLKCEDRQIEMEGINIDKKLNKFDKSTLKESLNKLINDFESYVNKYFIVAFAENGNEIVKLKAFVPDVNLDIVETNDWSDLITIDYNTIITNIDNFHYSKDNDIELTFTDEALEKIKDDDIISEKENKDENIIKLK